MIIAVDTNVLLDVFTADPVHGERSRRALADARRRGALIVCDIVLAELSAAFREGTRATEALGAAGASYRPTSEAAARRAGEAWRAYRSAGGPRSRLTADFLIGAHALSEAKVLLTRDRGFFRAYFAELEVLDPSDNVGGSSLAN